MMTGAMDLRILNILHDCGLDYKEAQNFKDRIEAEEVEFIFREEKNAMSEIDPTITLKMYEIFGGMGMNLVTADLALKRLLENGIKVNSVGESGDVSEVDDGIKVKLCRLLAVPLSDFPQLDLLLRRMAEKGVIFVPKPIPWVSPEVPVPVKYEKFSDEDYADFAARHELKDEQGLIEYLKRYDIVLCKLFRNSDMIIQMVEELEREGLRICPVKRSDPPIIITDFVMKDTDTVLISGTPHDCVEWLKENKTVYSSTVASERTWVALGGPKGGALPAEYYVLFEDRIVR